MRSRSNSLEDVTKAKLAQQQQVDTRKRSAEREEPSGRAERRSRHREPPDDTGTIQRNHKANKNGTSAGAGGSAGTGTGTSAAKGGRREKGRDLSRDDLVFLLSLLEGELQVILTAGVTEHTWIEPWERLTITAAGPAHMAAAPLGHAVRHAGSGSGGHSRWTKSPC